MLLWCSNLSSVKAFKAVDSLLLFCTCDYLGYLVSKLSCCIKGMPFIAMNSLTTHQRKTIMKTVEK